VWVPDLPDPDHPKIEEWMDAVEEWDLDKESLVVGHSCGGTLALRLIEALPENIQIAKAILVAAPLDKGSVKRFWPFKEDLAKGSFDWRKIKKSVNKIVLFYSDNDPYDCGLRHGEVISSKTGAELIVKKEEGHFNLEAGDKYKEFPEILMHI
jgi:predicted alpha/beta hydrolase family esterase